MSDPFDTVGTQVAIGVVVGIVLWILSLLLLPFLFDGAGAAIAWMMLFFPLVAASVMAFVILRRLRVARRKG
jgi:hypothetical protein